LLRRARGKKSMTRILSREQKLGIEPPSRNDGEGDIFDLVGELPVATVNRSNREVVLDVESPEMAERVAEGIRRKLGKAKTVVKVHTNGCQLIIRASPMAGKFLNGRGADSLKDMIPVNVVN
jgi:hypothetical protein